MVGKRGLPYLREVLGPMSRVGLREAEDAEARTLGGLQHSLPPLDKLRRHPDLVVDHSLFRYEARLFEKRVVVGRVLANGGRGEQFVRIDRIGPVNRGTGPSTPSGFQAHGLGASHKLRP